jgi:hypothetical protein
MKGRQDLGRLVSPAANERDLEIREIFSLTGVALYMAQVLEHGLSNWLVLLSLGQRRKAKKRFHGYIEVEKYIDDLEGHNFKRTLGMLIKAVKSSGVDVPETLGEILERSLDARNDIAHHFFRRHASDFLQPEGRSRMAKELKEIRILFERADQELDAIVKTLGSAIGVNESDVEKFSRMMQRGVSESDIRAYIRKKHLG